jgi:L-alanine-DL-glutamate epimerase-like enolase superfamily enzyme
VVQAIETMKPWIIGHNPGQITQFVRRAKDLGWHHYPYLGNTAMAAVEMALWDIVGKHAGLPISQLFGGTVRAAAPFYWYITVPDRSPEAAADQAAEGVKLGFKTMYLKYGFDIENDAAIARAVRERVGPRIAIRVDANEAWSAFEAVRALQLLEDIDLEFVEQPIDMHDLEGLAYLRTRTRTRIGANQSAWLAHNVPDILARRSADAIVTDPHQLGGLSTFRDVAALCEIAGIPLIKHSFGDLGITTAATLHVLGMMHEPVLAHQTHLNILQHDLLVEPLVFHDGAIDVPTAPGIGVELDRDALAYYGELYAKYGEFEGYSPIDGPSPLPQDVTRGKKSRALV